MNDKRSLFAENMPIGSFETCVEELSSKMRGELFFVVAGAMDGINHDRMHKHIVENPGWSGLMIEPLPDMFKKLTLNFAGRANLMFENSAVTDEEGVAEITRIPVENVDQECPAWADGISTLKPKIHIIGRDASLKAYAVTESVKTTRFETLVQKYSLANIDTLADIVTAKSIFLLARLYVQSPEIAEYYTRISAPIDYSGKGTANATPSEDRFENC